tara:strand:- start:3155 stop:3553 length:399 start_codon:yes stop_codon:yes gene_type:complete
MTTRDKIISHALDVSCKIFNANRNNVLSNNNRNSNTIKAKRMFIYYLYIYMEITHKGMNKYFRTINHASSIHHVNKFHFELFTYNDVRKNFNEFLTQMKRFNVYGGRFYEKRKEIKNLLFELKQNNNENNTN